MQLQPAAAVELGPAADLDSWTHSEVANVETLEQRSYMCEHSEHGGSAAGCVRQGCCSSTQGVTAGVKGLRLDNVGRSGSRAERPFVLK